MSEPKGSKIKRLISAWPRGAVYTAAWMGEQGFSKTLRQRYLTSGWIESIGQGAFKKAGDKVSWRGGLFAVQEQLGFQVHVGAKTALELQGYAHYVPLGKGQPVYLFGEPGQRLPSWFLNYHWDVELIYTMSNLFDEDQNSHLVDHSAGEFAIKVSCPEQAMLELLHLVPHKQTPNEALHLMEGLTNLRPKLVQLLLETCRSNKVKRTFLFLAERAGHSWVERLDASQISLGSGVRAIVKGGTYVKKYQISVPQAWLSEAG